MTGWQGDHRWQTLWVPAEAKSSEASFDLCSPLRSKPETWAEWNTWEAWRQAGDGRWMQMTQMTGATNWEKSKEYWRNTPFVYDCLQFSRVYRCNRYIISIELGEVRQVHGKSQMFPGVPSFGSLGSAQQGSELNMDTSDPLLPQSLASDGGMVEFTGTPWLMAALFPWAASHYSHGGNPQSMGSRWT